MKCFNEVKKMFTQAHCRASPDFSVGSKPFILTIDFSKQAVAAILSQEQHGAERFLGVKVENVECMNLIIIHRRANFWHSCMGYTSLTICCVGENL